MPERFTQDPFTRDVIAASLDAAATEMFDVLRKTAMSPIIYEVLDVGTGVTDADGELVSSGELVGKPIHTCSFLWRWGSIDCFQLQLSLQLYLDAYLCDV